MITVDFIRFAAMFIIFAALWRIVEIKLVDKDSAVGQAMAFIH